MDGDQLSLANLMGGAAVELFDREMAEVFRNLQDANTPPEKSRRITLEVVFKPFADRSGAEVEVKCESKLRGAGAPKTQIFLGRDKAGKLKAWSRDPRQVQLFGSEQTSGVQ